MKGEEKKQFYGQRLDNLMVTTLPRVMQLNQHHCNKKIYLYLVIYVHFFSFQVFVKKKMFQNLQKFGPKTDEHIAYLKVTY